MTARLLVLRPEPGASVTAERARAMGLEAIKAPLFEIRPLPWSPPETLPDAILLTSANALRHGGPQLGALLHLPVYAVGEATARAAWQAGFAGIVAGETDATAIAERARGEGVRHLLHLAGREHRETCVAGLTIERRLVYAADAVESLPDIAVTALPGAIALLHSSRAATLFATLVEPGRIAIAALSPAVLAAAGAGWRTAIAAPRPDDASLLAAAVGLCDQRR